MVMYQKHEVFSSSICIIINSLEHVQCFCSSEDLDDWLTVHPSIALVDVQLDAHNSYLFIYNKFINLQEPCVLYIGRAHRYPPDVSFYIFFLTNISTEYFNP